MKNIVIITISLAVISSSRQCCIFPPFFKREIAKGCGARFALMFINNGANVTGYRRETSDPCEHWQCVLQEYGLINAENKLDDIKFFTHLDEWVKLNPDFETVMINAKIHCKHMYRIYMPLTACEFYFLQSCIRNYINVYCPAIIDTVECKELTDFYQECREFYVNK
ncbi:uncharacterized protein [Epargyreus clarus]|uniref:uncharacterized protein isoform X2 n=1 Tax=Epargyreus clarus TaxID=520877 RepID=UPI003C2C3301